MSYFYGTKEKFGISKVGFIVMGKNILKNRVKTCSSCGFNGSGTKFKTCNKKIAGKRCDGAWIENIKPSCNIQIIINEPSPVVENLVMASFEQAEEGIKKENWFRNLSNCGMCEFSKVCWENDNSETILVPLK